MTSGGLGQASGTRPRLQALVFAFAIALTATQLGFLVRELADSVGRALDSSNRIQVSRLVQDLALLAFGVLLVAAAPRRSGFAFGTARHRRNAVFACLIVFGVSLAFRYSPFNDSQDIGQTARRWQTFSIGSSSWSSWLISPLAQELIFSGFILGYLMPHFPKRMRPNLPITHAVAITALLFGLWHLIPDLLSSSGGFGYFSSSSDLGYVGFRFAYTTAGMLIYGMIRVWTGTILYAVLTHTAVNFLFFEEFNFISFEM